MSIIKSISACKLYTAHDNKDKIIAAIQNPINNELVQQLSEYLDTDKIIRPNAYNTDVDDTSIDDAHTDTSNEDSFDFDTSSADDFFSDDFDSSEDIIDDDDSTADDTTDVDDPVDEDEPVTQSTKSNRASVTANTTLYIDGSKITESLDVLKGTLNSRSETCGVSRILVKENELWIHYSDSLNLNNVMGPVIELMNSSYPYLNFNRLARTENAIVFEISLNDTDINIGPIGSGD